MKTWIAEQTGRYRSTLTVVANSRKEANKKLNEGRGVCEHIEYYDYTPPTIVHGDFKGAESIAAERQ